MVIIPESCINRYTWFTLEALEETLQNVQKLMKVCIHIHKIIHHSITYSTLITYTVNYVQIGARG